jgi:predicted ribosome quality control (RQC) complex YloA/Tae2 family protein
MTLRPAELHDVIAELAPPLDGARLRGVSGADDLDLVFYFATEDGTTLKVLASFRDSLLRLHRATLPAIAGLPGPSEGVRRLAARLEDARVTALRAFCHDRAAQFEFVCAEGAKFLLRFEFFGKHPNWVLVGPDGTVEGLREPLHSRARTLQIGLPDGPPAPRGDADAAPSRFPPPGPDFPANAAIEEYYDPLARAAVLADAKGLASRRIRKRLLDRENRALGLRRQIEAAAQAPEIRRTAELLSAARHTIRRGATEVRLVDYHDRALREITVALDPVAEVSVQIEDLFSRARKMELAARHAQAEVETVRRDAEHLRASLEALDRAADIPAVERCVDDLLAERLLPREVRQGSPRRATGRGAARSSAVSTGFRTFSSADGLPILVGRGSKENDGLTFQVAHGNDWWLHVAGGYPGSHVVIRLGGQAGAPLETLLDAATLAVHFSKRRGAARAEVIYTPRKFVMKPRRAPAGMVTVAQEKRLLIDLDKARLNRLLSSQQPGV